MVFPKQLLILNPCSGWLLGLLLGGCLKVQVKRDHSHISLHYIFAPGFGLGSLIIILLIKQEYLVYCQTLKINLKG